MRSNARHIDPTHDACLTGLDCCQTFRRGRVSGTPATAPSGKNTPVKAQMPGQVINVVAQAGSHVAQGDPVLVLEAMKMEMNVPAPVSGTVSEVLVAKGDQVSEGQELALIES